MLSTVLALSILSAPPPEADVYALKADAFFETAQHDLELLQRFGDGMRGVMKTVDANQTLFSAKTSAVYTREQKDLILSTWGSLFAWFSATEGVRHKYWRFVSLPPTDPRHAWGFLLTHTALTALLANGLHFADFTLNNKQLETLLDEPNDDYGIPSGAFAAFKLKAIHVATSVQLFTGDNYRLVAAPLLKRTSRSPAVTTALAQMKVDAAAARKALVRHGGALFAGNAKDVVVDHTLHAIFPVQRSFAEWMGDTRVARAGQPLISLANIKDWVLPVIRPGDIVVSRQNWFLSNLGLPGFWPHAELYLGTPDELAAAFDADPDVLRWVGRQPENAATFSELLARRFPTKWKTYATGVDFQGHAPIRVIESISEGVSFTAVEHAFGVDYLGVLRPRLPPVDKARAIERAFKYQGRPYDFDFDFFSDRTLVCTELVYKAYQPGGETPGVALELVNVAGRRTLPANEIIKRFDADFGSPRQQLDFVVFIDGHERAGLASPGDEQALRASWKRVKWDLAQK